MRRDIFAASAGPPIWQPNTRYAAGAPAIWQGVLYTSTAAFTSGASFNPANWTVIGAPTELGYTEATANTPASPYVNTVAPMALPGMSVTVSTGARPILVDFYGVLQSISANFTGAKVFVYEDGVQVAEGDCFWPAGQQFQGNTLRVGARRNPAPGAHTYAVYGTTNIANAPWWLLGAANNRPFIRVTQH